MVQFFCSVLLTFLLLHDMNCHFLIKCWKKIIIRTCYFARIKIAYKVIIEKSVSNMKSTAFHFHKYLWQVHFIDQMPKITYK